MHAIELEWIQWIQNFRTPALDFFFQCHAFFRSSGIYFRLNSCCLVKLRMEKWTSSVLHRIL